MGEGTGVGESRPAGWAGVRLCNGLHKAGSLPKDEFKREVERELTGRETEPWKNDLQSRYWLSAHGNFAGNQVATKVTISPSAIAGRTIRTITQRVLLRTRFCHR